MSHDTGIFDLALLPAGASGVGDDEFGVWCEWVLPGRRGSADVVVRFRYIEPGEFMMGSPKEEHERDYDEGPQHPVTITRGFWLCDTACTQGLWVSVMGSNPSGFKGADRPVENVSWHEVQAFLAKLSELVPGCVPELPTEAEWEYACRAGTPAPFSFGETVTTEQANYNGDYPYAGGPEGEYRASTVPVRSFAPNGWGLYEMHGNVLEWCRDGQREYRSNPAADPVGPEGAKDSRVVRGGSWTNVAGWLRSADRRAIDPGFRYQVLGFRFCLRSPEPSQAGLAEPASVARGAGPRPPEGAESR